MHPAKRRRVESASSTLCKPFRSPLKLPKNDCQPLPPSKVDNHVQQTPIHTSPFRIDPKAPDKQRRTSLTDDATPCPSTEDVVALQKQYSFLAQQLRKLRQDLDVTEQALQIRSSNQKAQVHALILKWRNIARDAADDVFATAHSRVENMGGLKVWQDNAQQFPRNWDDDTPQRRSTGNDQEYDDSAKDDEHQGQERDGEFLDDTEEVEQDVSIEHDVCRPQLLNANTKTA